MKRLLLSDEVYNEITYNIYHKKRIDDYLSLKKMTLKSIEHNDMYEMLRKRLDSGESESIALAKKLQLPLIIDEKKGRKVAQSLGIKIIGFVGIILKLLEKEIIPKSRALEIVQEVEENNFRLSEGLKELIYSF